MSSETGMVRSPLLERLSHKATRCRTPLAEERRLDTSDYKIPYSHYAGREADLSGKVWDSDGIYKIKPTYIPPRKSGEAKMANASCMIKSKIIDNLNKKVEEKATNDEGNENDS